MGLINGRKKPMRTAVIVSVTSLIAVMVSGVMVLIALNKDVTTAIALVTMVLGTSVPMILALAKIDKTTELQRQHGQQLASVEGKVNGQMTALANAAGIPPAIAGIPPSPQQPTLPVDPAQKTGPETLP